MNKQKPKIKIKSGYLIQRDRGRLDKDYKPLGVDSTRDVAYFIRNDLKATDVQICQLIQDMGIKLI